MKPEHKILHQKFQRYGANAREWMRKCVLLLPEIEKHRIWEQKGFSSIYEYAAKLAGMSRDQVNEGLRILRKIEDKPALKQVVEEKGIGAVKPIVSVVTAETVDFWAEKARVMSKNTLETYVRELKKQPSFAEGNEYDSQNILGKEKQKNQVGLFETKEDNFCLPRKEFDGFDKNGESKKLVAMELESGILEELEKLKGQGSWNDLMKQLLQEQKERLEITKPAAVKTESRHIPVRIQKYVLARTNGQCSFPGCTKSYEILHHTQRFALEKIHDPDRLEPLCKGHERLAHYGLIEDEHRQAKFWSLRQNPDENLPKFQIDEMVQRKRMMSSA